MRILSELITRNVDNDRFVQLVTPFIYESDLLKKEGLKYRVEIPVGFVQDFESIPIVRGRNKRGGTVHDYFSCYDSDPIVTKWMAANLYSEMNAYTDSIDHGRGFFTKIKDWLRRNTKSGVVRIWPGFFHKRSVFATCKKITGVDGDPYVTVEKLKKEIKVLDAKIAVAKDDKEEKIDKIEAINEAINRTI